MKSNADQIRIVAWLTRPTSSQVRTTGCDQVIMSAIMSAVMSTSSKPTCAGIQKARREIPSFYLHQSRPVARRIAPTAALR
jgi:hypothetical protein